jgi:hypothetical protein
MTLNDIYNGAEPIISDFLRKELLMQGHHLTGGLEDSINAKIDGNSLIGLAIYYVEAVNEGFTPDKASFKMLPGMIEYFQKRGLGVEEAKRAAVNTIRVWMKEGMSTQASKRFSSTGERQHFIEEAFNRNESELDGYMSSAFDVAVEQQYRKTKDEVI